MGKPKQRKSTFQKIDPPVEVYNTDKLPPVFSFSQISKDPDFSFQSLTTDQRAALSSTLYNLSQLTWIELIRANKHGMGSEKMDRQFVTNAISNLIPEDCAILVFRFSGKAPMLGYRASHGIFHIIAFDTKFIAYEH